jgi:hypothetical protein
MTKKGKLVSDTSCLVLEAHQRRKREKAGEKERGKTKRGRGEEGKTGNTRLWGISRRALGEDGDCRRVDNL